MVELKKVCATLINQKIILFFHEHQSTVDTARNIAAWLNLEHKQMQKALNYLVSQKILIAHRMGSTTAYAYTQDKRIIDKIEKFLQKKG